MDEIGLQRLVDGALDADERREFLAGLDHAGLDHAGLDSAGLDSAGLDSAGLDSAPELWREVALAFVEEQVLLAELGAPRQSQDAADAVVVKPSSPATVSPAIVSPTIVSPTIVLAIAVSLLVVFGVGFRWGQWQAGPLTPSSPPRIATSGDGNREAVDVEPPRGESLDPAPAYRLMLAHQGGEAVELPVYERSQIGDLPWDPADMGRFKQFNETLVQRGYRADMQTEYLSGRLEDGRQIVVPYRTVSLKYNAQ
jgi:hypothetical protein